MKRIISLALVLVLASCADSTAPLTQDVGLEDTQLLAAKGGKGGKPGSDKDGGSSSSDDPASFVLRQAPTAPPLETYEVSFWAVRGQKAQVQVYYSAPLTAGEPDMPPRFLKFEVPERGLKARPDGSLFANGDSVLITLTIDPVEFRVDFAPAGLVFDKRNPADLKIGYKVADDDVDRDGDVDADDAAILQSGLSGFHYETVSTHWKQVPSDHLPDTKTVRVYVYGFSGYAISW